MHDKIRSLVYKMGFRPKPGTRLYSPGADLRLKTVDAIRKMHFPVMLEMDDGPKWTEIASAVEKLRVDQMPTVEETPADSLYMAMHFCVMCGSPLVSLVVDVKECPHLHGKVYISEDGDGLPTIVFEPAPIYTD